MLTDKAKERTEDYLRAKGINTDKNFRCLNPQHDDTHPSMRYNREGRYAHCFACGATYDIFDIIGLDYNLSSFAQKYAKACEIFGLPDEKSAKYSLTGKNQIKYKKLNGESSAEIERLMRDGWEKCTDKHYFYQRGLSESLINKYRLFAKDGRAYLPIIENGRTTAYCARAVDEKTEPRYKNSTGAVAVFNGDYIAENAFGDIYVCEGIFDALSLEELGFKAIAINGAANTGKLAAKCKESLEQARKKRFIIVPDNDSAGGAMAKELAARLTELGIECAAMQLDPRFKDANEMLLADRNGLKKAIEGFISGYGERYSGFSAASSAEKMLEELEQKGSASAIATGFEQLDFYLDGGLYSGLYIVGAISSLGKTTFAMQAAGHIAENGTDVLIFSLEMSKYELMAKAVSRITYNMDKERAFSAREILRGDKYGEYRLSGRYSLLSAAVKKYCGGEGKNVFIKEGLCDIGADDIRQAVREHIRLRGKKPVVIIDYLQILKPADPRATDKQNTDRAVTELKRISRDFDLPVIAVSSFNRDNYKTPVAMEAFKESGAVEYSSDVLIGLQLAGIGTQSFNINDAKKKEPRDIELVLLKNRNGIAHAVVELSYTAKFNCFNEKAREKPKRINRL
ncbi:MAG TPA: hypothetical protein DCP97_02505 [Ruminococcaceae bacterium]|nr:hypothetical protein [Oscillospiraceae bacterium]